MSEICSEKKNIVMPVKNGPREGFADEFEVSFRGRFAVYVLFSVKYRYYFANSDTLNVS